MPEAPYNRDQIAEIEAEIEALQDAAEASLRLITLARIASVLGIGAFAFGLYSSRPAWIVSGIAVALSALVLWGSTRSTRQAQLAATQAWEKRRAELIDALDLASP